MKMIEIRQSAVFEKWLRGLRDDKARAIIQLQLDRISQGNLGDAKPVGDGIGEVRIHFGPGYRLYFLREADVAIVLLCGGQKSEQARDIRRAKELADEWRS
ncbi:MAG: type II toxin-antitoxin system RelE/ParE family toxin [Devosia sp.]